MTNLCDKKLRNVRKKKKTRAGNCVSRRSVEHESSYQSDCVKYWHRFPFAIRSFKVAALIPSLLLASLWFFSTNAATQQSDKWIEVTSWGSHASFAKDYNVKRGGGYSLRIQNTGFADSHYKQTFNVEKNTTYRVSAMARYEGIELNSTDAGGHEGANVAIAGEWTKSASHKESDWKNLELEFNSGGKTEIEIVLRNGFYGSACKGTAWFCDFKLEKKETTPSTDWHILGLIFKNIDVTVEFKDDKNYHRKATLTLADIDAITHTFDRVPDSFKNISDNMMRITKMDIIIIDEPITRLSGRFGEGYTVNTDDIEEILDEHLDREIYDQIIVVSPLGELATGWAGLGGGFYKNIGFCQASYNPGYKPWHWFEDALFVHETLHCIESNARKIKEIASLHDAEEYGYDGKNEWIEWYRAYMRNTLPDKKGLPPEVFTVHRNPKYTLIAKDMCETSIDDVRVKEANGLQHK